jgi:phosphopantothenoylcysteine decarboxylase/phosphopantothenate--cysteine ligase
VRVFRLALPEDSEMKEHRGRRLEGRKILLGVTGGIGAYKAAELVRAFVKEGGDVSVVMTRSATQFISPLTMEALSNNPVSLDMFALTEKRAIGHIELAREADVFVVAPATANYIGKTARGIADDLLTTISLAIRCPTVIAPAMNARMWSHPAVSENIGILSSRGAVVVSPEEGELACGEEGPGRLAGLERILEVVVKSLAGGDLDGIRILVTAGPTRESLDPVRFLGNRSSGKMGYALAEAAARRGGKVTLISGPVDLVEHPAVSRIDVTTGHEMLREVKDALANSDWLIMAAAVADFKPVEVKKEKIKKDGLESLTLELTRNPDILKEVSELKAGRLFVGFAAETENVVVRAKEKMEAKGLDIIVANDVSRKDIGFYSDENSGTIMDSAGDTVDLPKMSKKEMADRIIDRTLDLWMKR